MSNRSSSVTIQTNCSFIKDGWEPWYHYNSQHKRGIDLTPWSDLKVAKCRQSNFQLHQKKESRIRFLLCKMGYRLKEEDFHISDKITARHYTKQSASMAVKMKGTTALHIYFVSGKHTDVVCFKMSWMCMGKTCQMWEMIDVQYTHGYRHTTDTQYNTVSRRDIKRLVLHTCHICKWLTHFNFWSQWWSMMNCDTHFWRKLILRFIYLFHFQAHLK